MKPDRPPNILLILADNLGIGDLGCYGQRNIKTPNLDALATNGICLTNFYVTSPVDAEARAAFLSGNNLGQPAAQTPCIAEALQQAGYYTCSLGEWCMAGKPAQRGFSEWLGFLNPNEAGSWYPASLSRYSRNIVWDQAAKKYQELDGYVALSPPTADKGQRSADEIFTTATLNFFRSHTPDQFNKWQPFFLFLGYCQPRVMATNLSGEYAGQPWPAAEKAKAAAISLLDANVGKIIAKLKANGQISNTIIVLSSDGGPLTDGGIDPAYHRSSGEFQIHPSGLGEGNLRVPLIVSCPGLTIGTNSGDGFWSAADLFPTLLEAGRATNAPTSSAISFWPALIGKPQTNRHEHLRWSGTGKTNQAQAIRLQQWKAIQYSTAKELELYDLAADPAEQHNIASQQPEIAARCQKLLR